jgi:hypothetical protein
LANDAEMFRSRIGVRHPPPCPQRAPDASKGCIAPDRPGDALGIHPEKQIRVLKERRISARVPEIDPGPPYAVFLQNTPILSDAVPRVSTLGWYALPRWGKWNEGISIPCALPPCPIPSPLRFPYRVHAPLDELNLRHPHKSGLAVQ